MKRATFHAYTFTVTGRGYFPVDMLRYDRCVPYRQDDVSHMITSRIPAHAPDVNSVTLISYTASGSRSEPTYDRWASFGWSVDRASVKPIYQ